jgi:8-oxo-dGTP pyrophosphatase MutT (NUDIX family)
VPSFASLFRRGQVAKAAAPAAASGGAVTPIDMAAAQQQTGIGPFSPGVPIRPAYGNTGDRPRTFDFASGYNVVARPDRDRRVSFRVLRDLIDHYDVARMAIGHRIDDVRSLDWRITPIDSVTADVSGAVDIAKRIMKKPDGVHPFATWLAMYLEDVLRYDAGALYKKRDRAGRVMALKVLDGTTIAPLLDYYGDTPTGDAPAYLQFVNGTPWYPLKDRDLVYVPFRPQPNSPYGFAPLEAVLITANTDIRFQMHFLNYFTEGTVPAGFAQLPPDLSTPQAIKDFQEYYDALLYQDESAKHQLKWVPAGTTFDWPKNEAFDAAFPMFLMRKVCAAYHVTPNDLGFTDDVNRSTSEAQIDVQARVGTKPLTMHLKGIIDDFLQTDCGLPVEFTFDLGEEKEDRESEARAHDVYVKMGAESVDEVRSGVLGLPIDESRPVPRFIYSERVGAMPLASLYNVAGPTDPKTAAPSEEEPLSGQPFAGVDGVLANKLPGAPAFSRAPINEDDPQRPQLEHPVPGSDVVAAPAPAQKALTAGITGATGLTGADLGGGTLNARPAMPDDDEDDDEDLEVAKAAELAAFRRFTKARAKAGKWRDFTFTAADPADAHRLNQAGRARVRKAAGQLVAAGLAVVAADTGRVLMLQRALDETDPAAGCWEFPGGCIEDGEDPNRAARREWSEETGLDTPYADGGDPTPDWTSPNGVYAGYIQVVLAEADVPIFDRAEGSNPDDPDGDSFEAIAWWDPAHLAGNPAIRPELADALDRVLPLIEVVGSPKAPLAKSWRDGPDTAPHHAFDLRLTDHYGPPIAAALGQLWTDGQLAAAVNAAAGKATAVRKDDESDVRDDIITAARDRLGQGDVNPLDSIMRQLIADAWTSGIHAAAGQLPGGSGSLATVGGIGDIDWSRWEPGHVDAAIRTADGALADALDQIGISIRGIVGTTLDELGNRIADGLLDGDPSDRIGRGLRDLLDGDTARAELIAHTETARAMDAATMDVYRANGIDQFDVITSAGACTRCLDLAAENPHPVSGGSLVPAHPRCRCASSPHVTY